MLQRQNEEIKIMVSAGELSGDQHASLVVHALKEQIHDQYPSSKITLKAMGAKNLAIQGAELIVDSNSSGSINGFNLWAIFTSGLFSFFKLAFSMYRWRPDILILVDYPDFNLRLAKVARLFKIPVFYYIPPKVWAWRSSRVKTIKSYIKHTAVIFPFEKEFFCQQGYDQVSFVGHPFVDNPSLKPGNIDRNSELKQLGLNPEKPVVAVFIGSRSSEVKRHLPTTVASLKLLQERHPEIQAIFAIAPSITDDEIEKQIVSIPNTVVVKDSALHVMKIADVGMLKSGTCNLEAAFLKLPFVCFYKGSKLTELIVKYAIKIKQYSLVNIIRPNTIKELIQKECSAENLSLEVEQLLYNKSYRQEQVDNFDQVINKLNSYEPNKLYTKQTSTVQRTASLIMDTMQKTKKRQKTVNRLFAYLKPYRGQFFVALICMILFGASDGVVPFMVKHILDNVFAAQDKSLLTALPFIMLGFTLIRAASDFGQEFLTAKIGHNIVKDFRSELHNHILKLTPDYFVNNSVGSILSRFTSDVSTIGSLLTTSLSSIIRDSIRIIALLATAFYLDPWLALIAFVFFPLGIWPVYRFGKRIRRLSRRGQDSIGNISSLVQESVIGSRVVKIFCREDYESSKFQAENLRLRDTFVKGERIKALTGPVNEILGALAISGVILYGGLTVINGVRSQGDFIAFLLSVFLLYDPFKKLSRVNNSIQQGVAGAERIFELIDSIPAVTEPANTVPLQLGNAIDFENVSFNYNEKDNLAVDNLQLHVPEGTTLAVVGYSGSGKSTLADLIPRFIAPQKGIIKIGGVDISKVSLRELRSRITMVGQHTFLFNDTVFNNIAYGNLNASIADVTSAAQAAHAHDFILRLPQQYQTIVGQDGYTLSGGERQRIAIARALLKNAPILILDEATAALDNRSEREVQSALEQLQKNRTTIVIAHRLSTIQSADCIIVMENGKIVEAGKHQELLDQGGLFARLYALQFAQQNEDAEVDVIN